MYPLPLQHERVTLAQNIYNVKCFIVTDFFHFVTKLKMFHLETLRNPCK